MARQDAADRNAFMEHCRQTILERGEGHPLRHVLLDQNGDWKGPRTDANQDVPTVQAGHVTTRGYAGEFDPLASREGDGFTSRPAPDRFALEDPVFNVEYGGRMGEGNARRSDFHLISREAVNIEGVPVDKRTAEMLERTGELHVPGGVSSLSSTQGWLPPSASEPDSLGASVGVESIVGLGLTVAMSLGEAISAGATWLGLTDGAAVVGAGEAATAAEATEVTTGPRIAEEVIQWSRAQEAAQNTVVENGVRYRVADATTEAALTEAAEVEAATAEAAAAQGGQMTMNAGAAMAGSAGDIPTPGGGPGTVADGVPAPESSAADSAGGIPAVPPPHPQAAPHDVPAPTPQPGDFPTPEPAHSDLPPEHQAPGGQVPHEEVPPSMLG